MKFQGHDLLSFSTKTSARVLVISSGTVIMANYLDLHLEDLSLFGVSVGEKNFFRASIYILYFQVLSHFVVWLGDWLSIRMWNTVGTERTNVYIFDPELGTRIGDVMKQIKSLEKKSSSDDQTKRLSDIFDELKILNSSVKSYGFYAVFYVGAWYFLVPITFAIWALRLAYEIV